MRGTVGAFHEQALPHLARQEEIAPEIEIDPRRGAARRAEPGIGVDGSDADPDAQERAEEEPVEEVVLEGELSDLPERGVLARQPEADPSVVPAELERELPSGLASSNRVYLGKEATPGMKTSATCPRPSMRTGSGAGRGMPVAGFAQDAGWAYCAYERWDRGGGAP